MATGEARRAMARDPRRVEILDRHGKRRWHPLWQGNRRIARPGERGDFQKIVNGPGCRPYVDYGRTTKARWAYTGWRCAPGELPWVTRSAPGGYVVIEPHIKAKASPNKDWGWDRWQALVRRVDCNWVQLGPPGTRVLSGVRHVVTRSFFEACEVLSGARAVVLPEGGLHHAAAALGVPAIVIFGGMTSPANTGYDGYVNLFDPMGGDSPCGQRLPCGHCARAMAAIKPDIVAHHLEQMP